MNRQESHCSDCKMQYQLLVSGHRQLHVCVQDQDLEVAVHHIYEDDHSVLNSMTSQYETLDEVPDTLSSRRRLMSEMKLADGAITEDDLPDDDEAEDGLREDEPPAKTRDLVRQLQRPLKSRDDVDLRDDMKPRGSVNLLAIGSRGWHRHRPHHHWHDWKKAACRKAMAPFNILLRGAKLALSGVNRYYPTDKSLFFVLVFFSVG